MKKLRLHRLKAPITQIIILATCYWLLATLAGCDAFVRKFTRKPKRAPVKEELLLAPEEYKARSLPSKDSYQQYFLFWKSWHNELIDSLTSDASHKKRVYCISEAIKNLEDMKPLLKEGKQGELEIYISELKVLKSKLQEDLYGSNISSNRLSAERIKRGILREFSFSKIKDYLV